MQHNLEIELELTSFVV